MLNYILNKLNFKNAKKKALIAVVPLKLQMDVCRTNSAKYNILLQSSFFTGYMDGYIECFQEVHNFKIDFEEKNSINILMHSIALNLYIEILKKDNQQRDRSSGGYIYGFNIGNNNYKNYFHNKNSPVGLIDNFYTIKEDVFVFDEVLSKTNFVAPLIYNQLKSNRILDSFVSGYIFGFFTGYIKSFRFNLNTKQTAEFLVAAHAEIFKKIYACNHIDAEIYALDLINKNYTKQYTEFADFTGEAPLILFSNNESYLVGLAEWEYYKNSNTAPFLLLLYRSESNTKKTYLTIEQITGIKMR